MPVSDSWVHEVRHWALLVLLGLAACGRGSRPAVLLLTIDTCRADRLSCYGYEHLHTVHLDALAAEGVLFEKARTCVPITLPSHVSIMTGAYPAFHGVRENGYYKAADSLVTLAEIFKEAGYATAAFVGAFPLESRFNLNQGFDHYGDAFGDREGLGRAGLGGVSIFYQERPAGEVNAEFFRWLDDARGEPFFAWLHYFDPHQPHEMRPPYDSMCAGRPYDAEIAYVDECVGKLRQELQRRGLLERTVLAVTSDHGEALGEHGELTHALLLYDSTLRVPMIIRCPQSMGLQTRVSLPVRTVDLAQTLLELAGVGPTSRLQGSSLVPAMRGHTISEEDHYYETFYGKLHFGWSVLLGYQKGDWKYVHGPSPELYDVSRDGGESDNLVDAHPEVAAELRSDLFQLVSDARGTDHSVLSDPDQETVARLRALGYVGSWQAAGPEGSWFDGSNPVQMMDAHQFFNLARGYVHRGMWAQAADAFREALDRDPNNRDARLGLVQSLLRFGDPSGAQREAWEAVSLYPHHGEAWLLLAKLLLERHEVEEAHEAAQRALGEGGDPIEGWLLSGECSEKLGDFQEAAHAYRRALEVDETHHRARLGLARCLSMTGTSAEADREFRQALEENPYWAPGHYNYGVFLLKRGERTKALERFRKAVTLSPSYASAHLAIAILLDENGDVGAALDHAERAVRLAQDPALLQKARALLEGLRTP
jgi:choline-sulfatase